MCNSGILNPIVTCQIVFICRRGKRRDSSAQTQTLSLSLSLSLLACEYPQSRAFIVLRYFSCARSSERSCEQK